MRPVRFLTFAGKVTAAHVITYLAVAAIAYPLFTKEFIAGMVYLRPAFTSLVHLKVQPEIIGQGLALGAMLASWMAPPEAVTSAK